METVKNGKNRPGVYKETFNRRCGVLFIDAAMLRATYLTK